jgi:colanic acid biosynthesis glycosyl transferase WcaI
MRILIYGLNYEPEWVGTGKFTGEMAHYLAEHGHQVRMVTAPPYYPAWRIHPGYSAWKYRRQTLGEVDVIRCPLWVPRQPSGITRLLHLLSFALSSAPALLSQAAWRPELILAVAPAIAAAPTAWFSARLFGCPAWLHIQDFELEAALRLEMLPGMRWLSTLLQKAESWLLNRFDHLSTISTRMQARLWQKGIPVHKTHLLPNWVDCQAISPQPGPNPYRQAWGLTEDQILLLYAGSMGEKQGLELILQAARQLQADPRLVFVLCGTGSSRHRLEALAAGLTHVRFVPLQPPERLHELLNAANIHLLVQRSSAADLVMPSKLTGMLASGVPVIATAEPGTELAQVISQVGRCVPPENLAAFCAAVQQLADQPDLQRSLGDQGRQYALDHLDQRLILSRLEAELRRAVMKDPP